MAKKNVTERVSYFCGHKRKAVQFFSEKVASEWSNPTFQSFWIVQTCDSTINKSNWLWNFTSTQNESSSAKYLNLFQFIIYFGAMLSIGTLLKEERNIESLTLAMIFVGGFVFHLFWEAKGQYTISYFVLLFPYAVAGYDMLTNQIAAWLPENRAKGSMARIKPKCQISRPFWVLSLLLCVLLWCVYSGGQSSFLTADTETYTEYLNNTEDSQGGCYVYTGSNAKRGLSMDTKDKNNTVCLSKKATEIYTAEYQGITWLYFKAPKGKLYLTVSDDGNGGKQSLSANTYENNAVQRWTVKKAKNGVYVMHGKKDALTCDPESGTVFVSAFTGDATQVWNMQQ